MKIVIAGAGEVGSHLAKLLSDEDKDIIVIDNDEKKLATLDSFNLMTYMGNPVTFKTHNELKVGDADLFIGVTPYETRNILACSMAKSLGAKRTVARIDNYEFLKKKYSTFFRGLGINDLIYPEFLAAEEIVESLKHTWTRNWFELFDGELIVAAVKMRESSQIVGRQLKEFGAVSNFMHVSAIKRYRNIIIPKGDDVIEKNDVVFIATRREHLDQVIEVCGKTQTEVKRLLIMGGSAIAIQVAKTLEDSDIKVKIIEQDAEICNYLADLLPHCKVVNGDATDHEVMEEEVGKVDAFAALSDRSETNILSCLMAKEIGVKKTIAEVESMQFIREAESLNIGTIVNKKLLASSRIFQILIDNDEDEARCLALSDAEVAAIVVKENSKLCKKDIKDLSLPDNMTIAGLVRDGVGMLVRGDTRLQAGDHVVVFCLQGSFHKVEKYFCK